MFFNFDFLFWLLFGGWNPWGQGEAGQTSRAYSGERRR